MAGYDSISLDQYLPALQSQAILERARRAAEAMPYGVPEPEQPNAFTSGVMSGGNALLGAGGRFVQALGNVVGAQPVADIGEAIAQNRAAANQAYARPDLETPPWREGGAPVLPWVARNVGEMLPGLAAVIVGSQIPGLRNLAPTALKEAGAEVPGFLGGGAGLAPEAAAKAGQAWAENVAGLTAAGYPMAAGSLYEQAAQQGDKSPQAAAAALGMGLPYSALGSIGPSGLLGKWEQGVGVPQTLEKFIGEAGTRTFEKGSAPLARALMGGAEQAAAQGVQGGLQTALAQTFNPNISPSDKMKQIVDSTITNATMGGLFGGALSAFRGREVPTEALEKMTDAVTPKSPTEQVVGESNIPPGGAPPVDLGAAPKAPVPQEAVAEPAAVTPTAKAYRPNLEKIVIDAGGTITPAMGRLFNKLNIMSDEEIRPKVQPILDEVNASPNKQLSPTQEKFVKALGGHVDDDGLWQLPRPASAFDRVQEAGDAVTKQGAGEVPLGEAPRGSEEVRGGNLGVPEEVAPELRGRNAASEEESFTPEKVAEAGRAATAITPEEIPTKPVTQTVAQGVSPDLEAELGTNIPPLTAHIGEPSLAASLPRDQFDAITANVTKKLPETIRDRFVFHDTPDDIPSDVKMGAQKQGADPNNIHAWVDDAGKINIVRSVHTDRASLEDTIAHELMHVGTSLSLGKSQGPVLAGIFDAAGGEQGAAKLATALGGKIDLRGYMKEGEVLTPERKSALMDEIFAQAAGTTVGKWKPEIYAWIGKAQRAAVDLFRKVGLTTVADRLDKMNAPEFAAQMRDFRQAVYQGGEPETPRTQTVYKISDTSNEAVKKVEDWAQKAEEFIRNPKIPMVTKDKASQAIFGFRSVADLMYQYAEKYPALTTYQKANGIVRTIRGKMDRLMNGALADWAPVERDNAYAGDMQKVGQVAAELNLAPGKAWENQPNLKEFNKLPIQKQKELRDTLADINQTWGRLSQGQKLGPYRARQDAAALQNLAHQTVLTRMLLQKSGLDKQNIPGLTVDPTQSFLDNPAIHENLTESKNFWKSTLYNLSRDMTAYKQQIYANRLGVTEAEIKAAGDEMRAARKGVRKAGSELPNVSREDAIRAAAKKKGNDAPEIDDVIRTHDALTDAIEAANNVLGRVENGVPYEHLGRHGEYAISFPLAQKDGATDADKMTQLSARLAKGNFDQFQFTPATNNAKAYVTFETPEQLNAFHEIIKQAQKDGVVGEGDVIAGHRNSDEFNKDYPKFLQTVAEKLQSSYDSMDKEGMTEEEQAAYKEAHENTMRALKASWIDMLPGMTAAKLTTPRLGRPGYSKDQGRNFAAATTAMNASIATIANAQQKSDALIAMRSQLRDIKTDQKVPLEDKLLVGNLFREIMKRESGDLFPKANSFLEKIRALSRTAAIAGSPAYVALQISQLGALTMPELAKKFGVVNSMGALKDAMPLAGKIMASAFRSGLKEGGPLRAAEAILSDKSIRDAIGNDETLVRDINNAVNRGMIDLGNPSRELGRRANAAPESKLDKVELYANAFGSYTEAFTRLTAMLAARKLFKENPGKIKGSLEDYIDSTITQSLYDYSLYNRARQFTNAGFAGPITSLVTQFYNYTGETLGKLYREFHTALTSDNDKAREEARTFLLAHSAAMTAMAGTMGLPFANLAFVAANTVADQFQEEGEAPHNLQASYRNFLSYAFGIGRRLVVASLLVFR